MLCSYVSAAAGGCSCMMYRLASDTEHALHIWISDRGAGFLVARLCYSPCACAKSVTDAGDAGGRAAIRF